MTAIAAAAKHPPAILAGIGRALSWVWHSDLAALTAVIHHQAPQAAQSAVLAVTLVLILAVATRRRRRSAG